MIPTPLLWSLSSSIIVTLGAHNIKQQERTQQVIQVKKAIHHPDYNPKTFSNDIMLLQARKTPHWPCPPGIISLPSQDLLPLYSFPSWPPDQSQGDRWEMGSMQPHHGIQARGPPAEPDSVSSHQLERKAKQTSAVKPLSLPKAKAQVKPGELCSLAGWGKVALGTPATTLQEVELTVQEDRVCESLNPRNYSRATQICVGDPRKVKTGFKVSFPASKHTDPGGVGRAEALSSAENFGCLVLESNVLLFFSLSGSGSISHPTAVLSPEFPGEN